VITDRRVTRQPPMLQPVVQYHGKWPFYRVLGVQEPFSVLFSALNFWAHYTGMAKVRQLIPSRYPLRPYYLVLGYLGLASWVFSMIFHTRDFNVTEKADYFAAGASVLYGLYYAPIRIFRLDRPRHGRTLWLWTFLCCALYAAHVTYLVAWRWDYGYNMAANVVVGIAQNVLWTWFSVRRYLKLQKSWAAWPGLIVAWIILAMSLELFDFPPVWGCVDAHSLWHLGTVVPTVWWYQYVMRCVMLAVRLGMLTRRQLSDQRRSRGHCWRTSEGMRGGWSPHSGSHRW
jgi:post-GPI attachment to proteins factor 3